MGLFVLGKASGICRFSELKTQGAPLAFIATMLMNNIR